MDLDVVVLLIVFTMPVFRKKVLNVIIHKTSHQLTRTFKTVLLDHYEGVQQYFTSTLLLTESLIVHENDACRALAKDMYIAMFKCADLYERQEIIGSIVTCIGSRIAIQADAGLEILLSLVKSDVEKVEQFGIFIKTILDCKKCLI